MAVYKRIIIFILSSIIACLSLTACNATYSSGIDLANMDNETIYGGGPVLLEINNKVYVQSDSYSAGLHNELPGIYQIDHGTLSLVYEGDVLDTQKQSYWIYFFERGSDPNTNYLRRYDTNSGEVETIMENGYGESIPVVCPAGIFWTKKFVEDDVYRQQIKWVNLDGRNEKVLFELGEEEKGYIGSLYIYHYSLYFRRYIEGYSRGDSNIYLTTVEYRLNLETGEVENPGGLQTWEVEGNETYTYKPEEEPVILHMYDTLERYLFGRDGWLYFSALPLWWEPETGLLFWRNNEEILYKVREDGTERTKVKTLDSKYKWPIWVQEEWAYYLIANGNDTYILVRMREDGSEKQTIISQISNNWGIKGDYLYYSLDTDSDGYPISNLYRINLDTLSEPERLY